MAHDNGTTHNDDFQENEDYTDQYYWVDHDNEEDKISYSDVIDLVNAKR